MPPHKDKLRFLEGKRILFTDDSGVIRMFSQQVLEQLGAEVVTAEHGAEALNILADNEFDVIFTDIFMPVMDGYELTKTLRKRGYEGIILGVSSASIPDDLHKLIDCGANEVIAKPLDLGEMAQKLIPLLKKYTH